MMEQQRGETFDAQLLLLINICLAKQCCSWILFHLVLGMNGMRVVSGQKRDTKMYANF